MGAMGIMALADQAPEMFATEGGRVAGVVMLCTSAGKLDTVTFGLPDVLVRFRGPLLPLVSSAGWVTAGMVDRARQASTQLAWLLTRRYGFGSSSPSRTLVSYVERMNSATPTEVVARYLRALYSHDRLLALSALKELAVLVICGEQDLLTPVEHSEAIVQVLPEAELVVVPDAGHALPLEHSEAVNAVLSPFVRRLVP
jgi:pimeloyl-ACP methyl ester carboxylesterase